MMAINNKQTRIAQSQRASFLGASVVIFTPLPLIPILSMPFFNRLICTGLNLGPTQDFGDVFSTKVFFLNTNLNLKPENFMQGEWREESFFNSSVL